MIVKFNFNLTGSFSPGCHSNFSAKFLLQFFFNILIDYLHGLVICLLGLCRFMYINLMLVIMISDAIAVEAKDSLAAETYANIVAVRPDNKDSEKIKALVSALQSDKVKSFIDEKYQGAVVAVF